MPLFLLLSLQDVAGDVHYVRRAVPWAMEAIGRSARCWLCIYSVFAVIEYLCDLSWLGRKIVTLSLRLLGTHVREYKRKPSFSFAFRSLNHTFEAWASKLLTFGKSKEKVFSFVFRSLNRNFEPMALRYSRSGIQKKNEFSFCIPLT